MCKNGLFKSTYLVGNIPVGSDPVGTYDHYVDLPLIHDGSSGIIRNDHMWDTCLVKFPGRKPCPLSARTGFIYINKNAFIGLMCLINRRQGGAIIDESQPSGIAMCANVVIIFDQLIAIFTDLA